ncbi:MAG: Nif3-like dinuclear metal center hexameric protein [Wolinella sp.]
MPKVGEIFSLLCEESPLELQESWDNSGLLLGSHNQEITGIYTALEATLELAEEIPCDSLLITHHPLIFKPLKSVLFTEYPSNILYKLIRKNIALISLHTNFDTSHLGRYVASEVLGFRDVKMEGYIGYFTLNMHSSELIDLLKSRLGITRIAHVGEPAFLERGAIITGSGGSLAPKIHADCLLSGDIKYHDAMIAKSLGIVLFDIGHYESERYFPRIMAQILKKYGYEAIITDSKNPFTHS